MRPQRDNAADAPARLLGRVRELELKTLRLADELFAGQYRSVFRGRGMDFDEVREYAPGDEVRAIDWNVTARAGRPHVKQFNEERELTVMLLVDVSASGEYGSGEQSKRERAAELAALLAFSAARADDKVGLVLFSDRVEDFVPPRKGRSHVVRLLRALLGCEPEGRGTDVAGALRFADRMCRRRALTFLVSDLETDRPALEDALKRSARRHDLVALHLFDPRELRLPDVGVLHLEDAETGEVVRLDTRRRSVRARFAAAADARMDATEALLRRCGVDRVPLPLNEDPVPPLVGFFEQRGRRRRVA